MKKKQFVLTIVIALLMLAGSVSNVFAQTGGQDPLGCPPDADTCELHVEQPGDPPPAMRGALWLDEVRTSISCYWTGPASWSHENIVCEDHSSGAKFSFSLPKTITSRNPDTVLTGTPVFVVLSTSNKDNYFIPRPADLFYISSGWKVWGMGMDVAICSSIPESIVPIGKDLLDVCDSMQTSDQYQKYLKMDGSGVLNTNIDGTMTWGDEWAAADDLFAGTSEQWEERVTEGGVHSLGAVYPMQYSVFAESWSDPILNNKGVYQYLLDSMGRDPHSGSGTQVIQSDIWKAYWNGEASQGLPVFMTSIPNKDIKARAKGTTTWVVYVRPHWRLVEKRLWYVYTGEMQDGCPDALGAQAATHFMCVCEDNEPPDPGICIGDCTVDPSPTPTIEEDYGETCMYGYDQYIWAPAPEYSWDSTLAASNMLPGFYSKTVQVMAHWVGEDQVPSEDGWPDEYGIQSISVRSALMPADN